MQKKDEGDHVDRDFVGNSSQSQCNHDGSTDHGDNLPSETGGGQCGSTGLQTRRATGGGGARVASGLDVHDRGRGDGAQTAIGQGGGALVG